MLWIGSVWGTDLLELPDEAAVLQVGFECLDGGGAVRETPDGGEALHGEVQGVAVLVAGPGGRGREGGRGRRIQTYACTHTHTHTHTQTTDKTHTGKKKTHI